MDLGSDDNEDILFHGTNSNSMERNLPVPDSSNINSSSNPLVEFEPPLASINRIVRSALPDNVQFGKEVKQAFQRSAGIFIMYLTACANEFSKENKRQTILPEDIFKALEELDFDDFVDPLKSYYSRLKDDRSNEKSSVKFGTKNSKAVTPSSIVTVSTNLSNHDNEDNDDDNMEKDTFGKDRNKEEDIQMSETNNNPQSFMVEEEDNDDVNVNNINSNTKMIHDKKAAHEITDGIAGQMKTTEDNAPSTNKSGAIINSHGDSLGIPTQGINGNREKRKREDNDENESEDNIEQQKEMDDEGMETIDTDAPTKAE